MDTWPSKQNVWRTIIYILGFYIDKETEYLMISPENMLFLYRWTLFLPRCTYDSPRVI